MQFSAVLVTLARSAALVALWDGDWNGDVVAVN